MKCAQLLRLLRKDGWYPVSQRGSHIKVKITPSEKVALDSPCKGLETSC